MIKTFDLSITKMSSKGQVVIPQEMRKGIKEGEKLVLIKNGKQIIMKKASDMDNNLEEDLEVARRTEEAMKRYEKGKFISRPKDKFLEELKKW